MIRLLSFILLIKNFFRLGYVIVELYNSIRSLFLHIVRRRRRAFHFSLRWNYALRKVFNKKTIIYHIIYFFISAGIFIQTSLMRTDTFFDIDSMYIIIGVYAFAYSFILKFMANWHQHTIRLNNNDDRLNVINRQIDNIEKHDRMRRMHPDDQIVNNIDDLYDV